MTKLTYEEWKVKQDIQFADGVREDLAKVHGLDINTVIEDILQKIYVDYLAEETPSKD